VNFLWGGKDDEDKRRQKTDQTWILFKLLYFGHILKKIAHLLFGAWSLLLLHIWFTPSEGPTDFVDWIF
jgi:hypothetical protein